MEGYVPRESGSIKQMATQTPPAALPAAFAISVFSGEDGVACKALSPCFEATADTNPLRTVAQIASDHSIELRTEGRWVTPIKACGNRSG